MIVLAIDPGQQKCGVAIVKGKSTLYQAVLRREDYLSVILEKIAKYQVEQIVLGDGTRSKEFCSEIERCVPDLPIALVDEAFSTEEARARFWQQHVRKGWRRFVPVSMQLPTEPYDDYVAVILAERFIAQQK